MMKFILTGITFCAASLLAIKEAKALTPVKDLCPNATWTEGYYIGEFIPLAQDQYKVGLVNDGPSNVRETPGLTSNVLFTLNTGEQVTIIGEAWDMDCNHWLRVLVDAQLYWMHGSQLQLF